MLLALLAGACSADEQSPENAARQEQKARDAARAGEEATRAGRAAPARHNDIVEGLQVAVRSAQEAQWDRGDLGSQPAPRPLKKACEDVQATAQYASALPSPHPSGYDEAIQFSRIAADYCLARIARISASQPLPEVAAEIETQLRHILGRVYATNA